MESGRSWLRSAALLAIFWNLLCPVRAGGPLLELHATRAEQTDLQVTGRLAGLKSGEIRYIRWKELRALPTRNLTLSGEFVKGEQTVTALMLADLWNALPVEKGADVVLADCRDGYASVYSREFLATHKPFVVLEIDGQGPDAWPPKGLKFNPGPYVISVSASVEPAVATLLDSNHKRPWGVFSLEFARERERNAAIYSGRWASLSPRAIEGREIWIHSCASCHKGPGGIFGGTKSDRPFEVLAAHAGYNQDYFKRYVRDPKSVISGAKMEAHPHYTEAQLDALIAFIVAEPPDKH